MHQIWLSFNAVTHSKSLIGRQKKHIMFLTIPNNNNNTEDATRPVVVRVAHLANLEIYPDSVDAAADMDLDILPV